jgi:hypothetical protein
MENVYVSKRKSIRINLLLHAKQKWAIKKALLDSGATECFIHPKTVEQLQLKKVILPKPQKVKNVDEMLNQSGEVTKGVVLVVKYNGKPQRHLFYVTNIGENDIILGYPFLKAANPKISWKKGTMEGTMILLAVKSHQEQLIGNMQPIWLAKTTTATQLAMEAASSNKREWHNFVSSQYHKFKKAFLESALEQFPERKKWDHTIDLKDDTSTSLDCRVYPLSQEEKKV